MCPPVWRLWAQEDTFAGRAALACTKPIQTYVWGGRVRAKFTPEPFVPSGF